jgi:hypothetical protein
VTGVGSAMFATAALMRPAVVASATTPELKNAAGMPRIRIYAISTKHAAMGLVVTLEIVSIATGLASQVHVNPIVIRPSVWNVII